MTDTITVELVTPEALVFAGQAEMVVIPGTEGDFGVLPSHAPLIATIRPGIVRLHETASTVREFFIGGGFAEVTGERCVILAEEAVELHAIDREKAHQRLEKARHRLERAKHDNDRIAAEKEIAVIEAMLLAK